jgi:hypothetical protein
MSRYEPFRYRLADSKWDISQKLYYPRQSPDRGASVPQFPVHNGGLVNANEQRNLGLLKTKIEPPFPDMISDRFELPRISFIYGLFRYQSQMTKGQRRGVTVDSWATAGRRVAARPA